MRRSSGLVPARALAAFTMLELLAVLVLLGLTTLLARVTGRPRRLRETPLMT